LAQGPVQEREQVPQQVLVLVLVQQLVLVLVQPPGRTQ
jgi:hypothetical protein